MSDPRIRPIESGDDAAVAAIIREVMPRFGACGPGFALGDPEVDHMSAAYDQPGSAFYVLEDAGRLLGCGGIAPLAGADAATCELRKMYFLPEARGRGLGERLLRLCLDRAREFGYRQCYLETLTGMDAAMRLYQRLGFRLLPGPLGNTGHFSCDRQYLLEL
jgi:putative acetyltransferase